MAHAAGRDAGVRTRGGESFRLDAQVAHSADEISSCCDLIREAP